MRDEFGWLSTAAPDVVRFAREAAPEEACGLMYSDTLYPIRNVSSRPTLEFAMDPVAQVEIIRRMGWPTAMWHTHPGGKRSPSTLDHEGCLPGTPMMIGTHDWVGVWVDGQLIMEVHVASTDIIELRNEGSEEEPAWRWLRLKASTVVEQGEGTFSSPQDATDDAYNSNPDIERPAATVERGAPNADTIGGAGGGGTGAGTTGGGGGYVAGTGTPTGPAGTGTTPTGPAGTGTSPTGAPNVTGP